jgi:MoxR-like ATPase
MSEALRLPSEQLFQEEIKAIKKQDRRQKPTSWQMSPWGVETFLMGEKLKNGFKVTPKYIGNRRLIQIAIATLVTDRALLLYGLPGTAKSWVAENIAAAISGNSQLIVQGTAGTPETDLRFNWNYAKLLQEGPSRQAIVESPIMRAMESGKIARVEELTRIPAEVQDTLITMLSEKNISIPDLDTYVLAQKGFNLIATANNRDKGINEFSSALKRRFNTVILPLPSTLEEEVSIVQKRVQDFGVLLELPDIPDSVQEIQRVVTVFRELRNAKTLDGKEKLKSPSATLSPAEAISVINNGIALSVHFGDGDLKAHDIASSLVGAIVKDPEKDPIVWNEYLDTVIKGRKKWSDLYRACKEIS